MNKENISIAKNTLKFLEKKSFNNIKMQEILKSYNKTSIKNKYELIVNLNRFFDYLLKKNLQNLEKSSRKDMIFEVFMARLDILNLYRIQIKKIINYLKSKPHEFVKIIPSFVETIILMSIQSNMNVNGIKGVANIKAIFVLYLFIIYIWNKDESENLEKTMTTLDGYLNNLEKFIDLN